MRIAVILALVVFCGAVAGVPTAAAQSTCVTPGTWVRAQDRNVLENRGVIERLRRQQVVLVGEQHDDADDHRWQLQVIAGLYALRQNLALGFEMFPRDFQPVLDQWVAGKLTETEFLTGTNWRRNWNFDPEMYLPLFRFARANRIPMLALNVDLDLSRLVQEKGWANIPTAQRQGVTDPAPAEPGYLDMLSDVFQQHGPAIPTIKPRSKLSPDEKKKFDRFVEGQLLWDGAIAQALVSAAKADPSRLIVGIMGSGHIENGFGVPHQLKAASISRIESVLPWHKDDECPDLKRGYATAVFGIVATVNKTEPKPRLGVTMSTPGTVVTSVADNSVAAASGLLVGDRIISVAGRPVGNFNDVVSLIEQTLPGTWLPLRVSRNGNELELVARFPAR